MKGLKIGVACVCLALAGYFFFSRNKVDADEIPNTAESATPWMCKNESCKNLFNLTARQYQEESKKAGGGDRPFGPLTCPKCGAVDSWRVASCPIHHIHFFVADVPGSRGVCPQCSPEPTEEQAAEEAAKPKKQTVPLF